jgi:hypothetical protein
MKYRRVRAQSEPVEDTPAVVHVLRVQALYTVDHRVLDWDGQNSAAHNRRAIAGFTAGFLITESEPSQ